MQSLGDILGKEKVANISSVTKATGFTQVPNWFLVSSEYSAYDKLVCIMLKKYKMTRQYCWPSIKTLAKRVGCSESTVKKSIKNLIKAGLVVKDKNKKIRSNIYYVKI